MNNLLKYFEQVNLPCSESLSTKEIINLDAVENLPAVKKSSMSLSDVKTQAIKKSSFNESELKLKSDLQTGPHEKQKVPEKPYKVLKLEKNDSVNRVRKPEETRLSSLSKMRQKYCVNKNIQSEKSGKTSLNPSDQRIYEFSQEIKDKTNITQPETLEKLEFSLKFYLRNHSKILVNSYDFSENPELCQIFKTTQLRYLDIPSFILSNSNQLY